MVIPAARMLVEKICVSTDPGAAIRAAVSQLRAGNVIAVPTDTIYGLAASAQNSNAISRLYEIKARDENKPVAICVSKVSEVHRWGVASHLPDGLLSNLLPGPVTVVLARHKRLNPQLNYGNGLVGVRVPDDRFMREVARRFGGPIALTSANSSTEPSSLHPDEFQHLWNLLGAVYDGGTLVGERSGSTVVDLSGKDSYKILRDGSALKSTVKILEQYGLSQCKQ